MAVYKCSICGAVFDEEQEGKMLSELSGCPVCKQPISKFEKISEEETQEKTAVYEGALSYDPQYVRQDKNSRYMEEIHQMAVTGKSIDGAMGTQRTMPGWDDIYFLGAQLNPMPLLDFEPVETRTVIGTHARKPMVLEHPYTYPTCRSARSPVRSSWRWQKEARWQKRLCAAGKAEFFRKKKKRHIDIFLNISRINTA